MAVMSYPSALRWWCKKNPERTAIVCGAERISRGELDDSSNRLAREYRALGVGRGDHVTIGLANSIAFFQACFACWKLGATPQPVSSRLPQREQQGLVELAKPTLIVGGVAAAGPESESAGDRTPIIKADRQPDTSYSSDPLEDIVSEHTKAMASGGSTGKPKLIVDPNPDLWDPEGAVNHMQLEGCLLVPGPLYHNGPFVTAFQSLLSGGTVVVMERFDERAALQLIEQHRVDWVLFVPTMMHRISRLPAADKAACDVSSLRIVMSTAAPVPAWLKRDWIDWLGPAKIYESYGGSERIGGTQITGTEWLAHPGSVGRPFPGVSIAILDADGQRLPIGEIGEVFLRPASSGQKSSFYIGGEQQSLDGYQTLGDLGYLDKDGYLYLVDRRVDMIVSGGANIYPAEVEGAIQQHAAVRSAAVIGLPDDDLGQRVHAIVDAPDGIDISDLLAHLAGHLVKYKIPRTVELVSEILRDDAGKVRRSALRDARIKH